MAVIGTIRKHSALAVILVGVAIAAFILSDLFTKPGSRQMPAMGVIDGEEISANEYNRRVDENIELQRANQGKENLTQEESFQVRNTTWDQYIMEIIMGKEYEKLGLTVTSEELFDLVQGPRPHQLIMQYFADPNTGQYNPQIVLNFLQNIDNVDPEVKKQWINLEKYIKEDRLQQKYASLISRSYYVPQAMAREDFFAKKRTAAVRYVGIRYSSIADADVTVTDKDYEKYYEEHKNQYTQDPTRDVDYVMFEVLPSQDDRARTREEVMRLYEEFQQTPDPVAFVNASSDKRYDSTWFMKGQLPVQLDSRLFDSPLGTFVPPYEEGDTWHMAKLLAEASRPDSMKAEHILVSFRGAYRAAENITRTKEQAEKKADSLLRLLQFDKDRLQALAVIHSDDGSARNNKGDLGWFADGAMVAPFNEAVVNGKTGDLLKVETIFGYHVIKITGKKDPVKKIRVAVLDRAIEPSSKTFQDTYTQASIFAGDNNTKEKFDRSVEEKGLNKRSGSYLREMSFTIPGIENPREIVRWAFSESVKLGEVSPVFDVGDAYVVATLTVIRDKGTPPLAQLKENIKTFVYNEKKAAMIIDKVKANSGSLYQIAAAFNAKVDTNASLTFASRNIPGYGSEFQVIGQIFTLPEGQISEPLKGNGAVFVVQVDRFIEPAEGDLASNRQQLEASFKSRVNVSNILNTLKENVEIEDHRALYY